MTALGWLISHWPFKRSTNMADEFRKSQEDAPAEKPKPIPDPTPAKTYDPSKTNFQTLFPNVPDLKISTKPPKEETYKGDAAVDFVKGLKDDGKTVHMNMSGRKFPEGLLEALPENVRKQMRAVDEFKDVADKWNKKFDSPIHVMSALASVLVNYTIQHGLIKDLSELLDLIKNILKKEDRR